MKKVMVDGKEELRGGKLDDKSYVSLHLDYRHILQHNLNLMLQRQFTN